MDSLVVEPMQCDHLLFWIFIQTLQGIGLIATSFAAKNHLQQFNKSRGKIRYK
jgi:hypothetical protein